MGVDGDALLGLQLLPDYHLLALSLPRLKPACGKSFHVKNLIIGV
jgi:hypothetical protein